MGQELCNVIKGMDKRNDERVLNWCGQIERIKNNKIVTRIQKEE